MERIAARLTERVAVGEGGEAVREVCRLAGGLVRMAKERMIQAVIEKAVTDALGVKGGPVKAEMTPWSCRRCGLRSGEQIRRNGHYRRELLVIEGVISLRVPQLICVGCGKSIGFEHPLLVPRQRVWQDIEQRILTLYLEGCSYRAVKRLIERECGTTIGLMTLWRSFQGAGRRPRPMRVHPPSRYLFLDEVYHKVKGVGYWFLCARVSDGAGKLRWVGFVQSETRSQEAWEAALDELGLSRYNPPFAVVSDGDRAIEEAARKCFPGVKLFRCTWHLKHNAAEWIRQRFPRQEQQGTRKGLMAAVHSIIDAPTLQERAESLAALRSVHSWLADNLDFALKRIGPKDAAHPVRTNNAIERGFREQRRRTRPMDGFGSNAGANNFLLLWMLKENARTSGRDYLPELIA